MLNIKRFLFICIFMQGSNLCFAQTNFYAHVPMGKYGVGFVDTLIYDSATKYAQFDYRGHAPLFVQVWHPIKKAKAGNFLTYGDFSKRTLPKNLETVFAQLCAKTDTAFIETNLTYALNGETQLSYGNKSIAQVLAQVKSQKTKSIYARQKGIANFPVIVYHHGAQGVSDENYIMGEYFASRGYIFVSANFHLPYEDMPLGSEPFLMEQAHQNNVNATRQVIQFAKGLSNGKLVFMGHSWGAQTGWCVLHEQGLANAFVSFETTLEFKTDTNAIKEKWPLVYTAMHEHAQKITLPVLMFAATQTNAPFTFFKQVGSAVNVHASAKNTFEHNSYTAVYFMRYFLPLEFGEQNKQELYAQLELYGQHLAFTHHFLQSVLQGKTLSKKKFGNYFFIH